MAFDSAVYFEMAAHLRAGQWAAALAYPYPPLYALLIALVQTVIPSAEAAGLLITLAADLLVLWPLIGITRAAAGERAAWGAALLWAIHPYAVRLGAQALTDAPTAFLVGLALYAGLRAAQARRVGWALGAGAASGLAYLLRPEGMEAALALGGLYAAASPESIVQSPESRAVQLPAPDSATPAPARTALRRAVWALAPLAGLAIVASPYVAYVSLEAGAFTLSKKKSPAAFARALVPLAGHQPSAASPQQPGGATQPLSPSLQPPRTPSSPRTGPGRALLSLYIFQRPLGNGIHPVVMIFGVIGGIGLWRSGPADGAWVRRLLAGLLGLHLAILVGLAAARGPGYLGGHHFFLMVLYALPFAGAGLAGALAWGEERLHLPRWSPAVAVALLVTAMALQVLLRRPDQGRAVRPAAAWIRAQVTGTPVVVTSLAKLTYHAGAERVELQGEYDEILGRARARSAQFVAFYPDMLRQVSPDFLSKLKPADLEFVRAFPEPSRTAPDRRLEVYRLKRR
ncbi:MAG TPA: glycosyltransferase family 39 protein [Candidatus Methylomirabilis sp.]